MTSGLPRLVVVVLSSVVPARDRRQVLAELDDDYRQVRSRRSRLGAAWWLVRELSSLGLAFTWAALLAPLRHVPLWTRDLRFVTRGMRRAPCATLGAAATLAAGLLAVLVTNWAPIDGSTPLVEVRRERGAPIVGDVTVYLATSRYFETVGVPLLHGRAFTAEECDGEADVVVVNDSVARRLWPDGDALGRSLIVGPDEREVRVVGVARDSKYRSLAEAGQLHVYRPTAAAFHLTLLARATGDARDALGALQRALDGAGPGVVGFFPRTLADHLEIELLPTRAAARAAAGLGGVSLLLSVVGLYGLVSWFVERRRREIGVRLALGARPADIVGLVVRQTVAAAVPGLLAGLGLAVLLGVAVRSTLHGIGPLDPVAFLAGVLLLTVVVTAAAWAPSWRASRVDPTVALRES